MEVIRTQDTISEVFRRRESLQTAIDQLGRAFASVTGAQPFEAIRAADGITVAAGDSPNFLRIKVRALPFDAGCEWLISDVYGDEGEACASFVRSALRSQLKRSRGAS